MKFSISFPLIIFCLVIGLCIYMTFQEKKNCIKVYPIEKLGLGKASKTEFSGHRYIIWQQNISDCIVHDPDCECQIRPKIIWDENYDGMNIHDLDCNCCIEQNKHEEKK